MAFGNSGWGYCRVQGSLKNTGHTVATSSNPKILKEHGIKPAPNRPTTWRTFIKVHANVIVGAEFLTAEVWTAQELSTCHTLFLLDHETRAVHLADFARNPDERFMTQVARDPTNCVDGFLLGKHFLVIDRDSKFTKRFKARLKNSGIEILLTPFRAPNANAIAESLVQSNKTQCLDMMILSGRNHL